jgi:hypothetical protein
MLILHGKYDSTSHADKRRAGAYTNNFLMIHFAFASATNDRQAKLPRTSETLHFETAALLQPNS